MRYQRAELPLKLDGLKAARSFFSGCFPDSNPRRESLWVAHVDDQARCLHLTRHDGDEQGAKFPLRAIIADAAAHGSAGIVLAHNHPSNPFSPQTIRTVVNVVSLGFAATLFQVRLPSRDYPQAGRLEKSQRSLTVAEAEADEQSGASWSASGNHTEPFGRGND